MPLPAQVAVILPFPEHFKPVERARSTIIRGSIASLKGAGQFERYLPLLTGPYRENVLGAPAGTWLALDVALAHYRACDLLALSEDEAAKIGRAVFERVGATLFGTALRLGKSAGVTPWTVLEHLQRFWERGYDGGAVRVMRLGPKEARIDMARCALANNAFYRHAIVGLVGGVVELFCRRAFITVPHAIREVDAMSLRVQWV
jgi:hypothetical protein